MKRAPGLLIMLACLTLPLSAKVLARGTPAQAKVLLRKAVAHYAAVGRKQALADFTGKKTPFGDRDLYVFCIAPDRTIAANGGFPELVGETADALKDADGRPVGGAMWDLASQKGKGSIEYLWLNPISRETEPKVSFVQKAGEDVCGVGAYNPVR